MSQSRPGWHVVASAATLVAAVACGVTTPTSEPSPSGAVGSSPIDACARPVTSRDWTTLRGYHGGVVPRGDDLELGLNGKPQANVRLTVAAPDGSELTTGRS